MSHIIFYCNNEKSTLDAFEYYKQDIDALKTLGHKVTVCTKYREIPFNFDAMFIWWWTYALWPALLCRLLNKPCIITGVYNFRFPPSFEGTDYFRRPYWQRFLIKTATHLGTLNLFLNEGELKSCSEYFNLNNARYFPCVIHSDYLKGPSAQRKNILFNLAWSGKQNLIRKGIPELLQAVKILKDEGVGICLNLAGHKGDGAEYLLNMIQQLEIQQEVTWLGPLSREDKISLLRTCEIYVQPSHYEGFGVAIAEAMGCGACIITCDVGAVRAVVGDCGIYVAPGSPSDLAKAIKAALYDDALRNRLQDESHQRACRLFATETKLQRLKSYLAEIGIS